MKERKVVEYGILCYTWGNNNLNLDRSNDESCEHGKGSHWSDYGHIISKIHTASDRVFFSCLINRVL